MKYDIVDSTCGPNSFIVCKSKEPDYQGFSPLQAEANKTKPIVAQKSPDAPILPKKERKKAKKEQRHLQLSNQQNQVNDRLQNSLVQLNNNPETLVRTVRSRKLVSMGMRGRRCHQPNPSK
jgi:hypothetical protein